MRKVFVVSFILLSVALSARASTCRQNLEQALNQILESTVFDLAKMDQILVEHINEIVSPMGSWRQRRFLKKLKQARLIGSDTNVGLLNPNNYGQVKVALLGTSLRLQRRILSHPIGRLVLAHEAVHLKRAVTPFPFPLIHYYYPLKMLLPRGLIREERAAFSSQYHFTRKVYTADDLDALAETYSKKVPQASVDILLRHKIIKAKENGEGFVLEISNETQRLIEASAPIQRAVSEYFTVSLNEVFLQWVTEAVTKDEEDFLEDAVHDGYHAQQRVYYIKGALFLLGGGYLIWDTLF